MKRPQLMLKIQKLADVNYSSDDVDTKLERINEELDELEVGNNEELSTDDIISLFLKFVPNK